MKLGPWFLLALAQLPPSPDPKSMPVAGVLHDASGAAGADADVWLAQAIAPADGRRSGTELLGPVASMPASGMPPTLAHAHTDAAGRFGLDVPAEIVARRSPVPIWASVNGQDARPPPVKVRLARTGEPPIHAYKTLPPALPPQEEKALVHRLIELHANHVFERGTDQEKYLFLMEMARFDPAGTLERL